MPHKLKTLGVALFAVLALTAFVASAASAANYTAGKYPTTGTGTSALGNDVFTTEGGTVECASHFEGTLTEAKTDLTVNPTYTNCKAFGFINAKVTGCKFTFTEPTGKSPNYTAGVDLTSACTIETSGCHVTVPIQGLLNHVGITNDVSDVSVQATVTGIEYTVITDGFLCPFSGTGTKTGGTYTQKQAITFSSTNGASIDVG